MNRKLPQIGIVIIGINEEAHIADCIRAVRAVNYPQELLEIVYADGGSTDRSAELASGFEGVRVIKLDNPHPTPGRGRNAGWRAISAPIIQFLDADMIIDPDWFLNALEHMKDNIAAVCGSLNEIHPEKNIYHILAEMEWAGDEGLCDFFGGGVLIKRNVLLDAGGYDETLIAGEDPELSYRVRKKGWSIRRIKSPMARHDINMSSFYKYLKRSFRSGYAYAEVSMRFIKNKEKMWLKENIRISLRTLLPLVITGGGFAFDYILPGIIAALIVIAKPLLGIPKVKIKKNRSWNHAVQYGVHTIIVIYPQFLGLIRYFWGRINCKPLRNNITQKTSRQVM